jgi:protease I
VKLKIRRLVVTDNSLHGMRVAILVTNGFEEIELTAPRTALENAGAKTSVVAPKSGTVYGMKHLDKAGHVEVDMELKSARPADFDAVLLPGGALNADALRVEKAAQEFVREIDRSGKPIAVICHAPWLLVSAGLVRGRTLTSYHTIQDDIQNAGGKWVDQAATVDNNWVSSRQPDDIPAFNTQILALFGARKLRSKVAS